VANLVYNRGKFLTGQINLAATSFDLVLMLCSTSFTSDDGLNLVDDGTTSDPKSYEISVSGYTRQTLANRALYEDDTNDFAGLDATDVTFTALAAGATIGTAVLYRYSTSGGTTSDTGQDLIAAYDVTDTPTNGGDITIAWASTSAGSVLKLGSTS
jgi:hypothetical protein